MKEIEINYEVIHKIKDTICEYENIINDNIEQLAEIQKKLSIYGFYLSEILSEMKSVYNYSYLERKIKFHRAKQRYIEQNNPISKAENIATIEVENELKKELENETIAYKFELYLQQINIIINTITMKLSILKKEIENSNKI